jgi:3',5'-nucleoside bisphosphate phosphatase
VSPANFDFHCHSAVSDGLLSPQELAQRAAANGVDLWALTDHDELGGLEEAGAAAAAAGVQFVSGVEVSIGWNGLSVHIVGLGFDPAFPALRAGLEELRSGRVARAGRMSEALAAIGIPGVLQGAMRFVRNPRLISRAHFARYLAMIGIASDVPGVFQNYLRPGKPGYVDHRWPTIEEAVGWITGAGGVAVVAHPGRYKMADRDMRRFLAEFKDVGGRAIEVVSGRQPLEQTMNFARLARHYDLHASCGSDFHGPLESSIDLGCLPPLPDDVKPVWQLFC